MVNLDKLSSENDFGPKIETYDIAKETNLKRRYTENFKEEADETTLLEEVGRMKSIKIRMLMRILGIRRRMELIQSRLSVTANMCIVSAVYGSFEKPDINKYKKYVGTYRYM